MIDTRLRQHVQPYFNLVGKYLHQRGFTPDQITLTAFVTGVTAGLFISRQWMAASLALLWLSGVLDVLDGTVARIGGATSRTGALMDLILDRMVEAAVILGFYAINPEHAWAHLLFLSASFSTFPPFWQPAHFFPTPAAKACIMIQVYWNEQKVFCCSR